MPQRNSILLDGFLPLTVMMAVWAVARLVRIEPLAPSAPVITGVFAIVIGVLGSVVALAVVSLEGRAAKASYSSTILPPLAIGLLGGLLASVVWLSLNGTPYAVNGIGGDAGRLSAMATKYTHHIYPLDAYVKGVFSEYPPLYPWLIGRVAQLLDGNRAWELMRPAQALTFGLVPICGYWAWRTIKTAWVAVGATIASFVLFPNVYKPFEVLALAVAVPWFLWLWTTLRSPKQAGVLGARCAGVGLIGGSLVSIYVPYVVFALPAVAVAIMVAVRRVGLKITAWRVLIIGAAVLVASGWWVIPYVAQALSVGGQLVGDRFAPSWMTRQFPVANLFRPDFASVLVLAGLVVLPIAARSADWARALGLMALSVWSYRLLAGWLFGVTGGTRFFSYTTPVLKAISLIALTLAAQRIWVAVRDRSPFLEWRTPLGLTVPFLVVGLMGASLAALQFPAKGPIDTGDVASELSALAYGAYEWSTPDGTCPSSVPCRQLDVTALDKFVRENVSRKPDDFPVMISAVEEVASWLPWYYYLPLVRSASATAVKWDERHAILAQLSRASPDRFASAVAQIPWGPIDGFLLLREQDGSLSILDIRFSIDQFAGPCFKSRSISRFFITMRVNGPGC